MSGHDLHCWATYYAGTVATTILVVTVRGPTRAVGASGIRLLASTAVVTSFQTSDRSGEGILDAEGRGPEEDVGELHVELVIVGIAICCSEWR